MKEANLSLFHQNIYAFRKEGFTRPKGMESKMNKISQKITALLLLAFLTSGIVGCTGEATTENRDVESQQSATQAASPPSNHNHEWTIEELGATIIAAGEFWNDWWNLGGAFAWEHIDDTPWDYWAEQPDHPRSRGLAALLPSSGFETITDIALHLQHFYTDTWINREMFGERTVVDDFEIFFGDTWAFEGHDEGLFINPNRWGSMRSNWTTANHLLIEQDGNRAVVETTVTAYDHRGDGGEMPTAIFRFVFYDGRIESGLGQWTWPNAGDLGVSDTATAGQGFYAPFGDYLLFAYRTKDVVLESFDSLVYIPHPALEGIDIRGEDVLIGASRTIYNISLILIENIWDEVANQDGFTVTESFLIAEALQSGEAIIINGYVGLGLLPWSGITFTTAPGERHFFAINHDNSDSLNWFVLLDITGQMLVG